MKTTKTSEKGIYERGGKFLLRFRWDGRQIAYDCGTDFGKAKAVKHHVDGTLKKLRQRPSLIPPGDDPIEFITGEYRRTDAVREQSVSFAVVAEKWLANRKKNKAATTIGTNRQRVRILSGHFGTMRPDRIRTADVQTYIEKREAEGVSGATIKRQEVMILRSIVKPHKPPVEWDELSYSTAKPTRDYSGRDILVEDSTLDSLMETLREFRDLDLLDFVRVAQYTGARRREIAALTPADVDFETGYIRFIDLKHTKGKERERFVKIHPALLETLERRMTDEDPKEGWFDRRRTCLRRGKLFPPASTMTHAFRRAVKRTPFATNPGLGYHALRVRFVTTLLAKGHDLGTVQKAVGHKSVTTTAIYSRANQRAADDAVSSL